VFRRKRRQKNKGATAIVETHCSSKEIKQEYKTISYRHNPQAQKWTQSCYGEKERGIKGDQANESGKAEEFGELPHLWLWPMIREMESDSTIALKIACMALKKSFSKFKRVSVDGMVVGKPSSVS
jgi:hypothetical protein